MIFFFFFLTCKPSFFFFFCLGQSIGRKWQNAVKLPVGLEEHDGPGMGGQSFMPVDDADTVGPTSDPTLELFRLFWILLPAVPELAQGCSLVTEVAGCGIELHGFSLEVHGSFQVFYFHLLSSSYFPTQSSSEDKALSGLRRSCGISLLAGAASSLSGIVGGNVRSLFSTIIPKAVSKHWTGIH